MATQQQPRRWFFLGSFGRSAQQQPPRRPATQKPVTRPQVIQIRTPAPQPSPPQAPPPTNPPAPAKSPIAASPAANVASAQPPVARPPPLSAVQPRPPPPAPVQKSPPAVPFPARPPPPAAPAPRPLATATSPTNSTTRPPTALQPQIINKPASPSPSPPPSAASPTAIPTAIVAKHAQTKVSSPKTINEVSKTPPQPTQIKPITYPPSQTKPESNHEPKIPIEEFEQKTILRLHETPQKPNTIQKNSISMEQKNPKTTNKNANQNEKGKDTHKKFLDSENSLRRRTITVAGENKGAVMGLNSSYKKRNSSNGWRINGNEEEEKSNIIKNGKSEKPMEMQSSSPRTLFINSNVQGINNAILYNGSFKHGEEGVRLSFSGKPINGGRGTHLKNYIAD